MPEMVFFTPNPGVLVPKNPRWDPGQYFAAAGEWVARDDFLDRRVAEGAGAISDGPPAVAVPPVEPAAPLATDHKE